MASDFLNNLKNAVDTGEFNSDAAKKINEINTHATKYNDLSFNDLEKKIENQIKKSDVKTVNSDELGEINNEYDKKMYDIKEKDLILQQRKTLIEIDEIIVLNIVDLFEFIKTLEEKFSVDNANHVKLFEDINNIKKKYGSLI